MASEATSGVDQAPAVAAEPGASGAARERREVLRVEDLRVELPTGIRNSVLAVEEASLVLHQGERIGIVGESGSGKSITARAIAGLLPPSSRVRVTGSVRFEGKELLGQSARDWNAVRAKSIGMIFQDPLSYLNPTQKVGRQLREALSMGNAADKSQENMYAMMRLAGLKDVEETAEKYPFELSGGMRQRVLISFALARQPQIIIADEPTTALDATVQRHVLRSLDDSVETLGSSMILISHDLAVVSALCERVYVMFRGRIVESGTTEQIFEHPQHEYTQELIKSVLSFTDDSPRLYVSQYGNR